MDDRLPRRTGKALVWKSVELAGTNTIGLLRSLVLARLLVPDDFGLMAIGLVSVQFGIRLTSFGMHEALIQAGKIQRSQYDAAWTFEILRGLAIAVVIAIAAPVIATEIFGEPRAASIIRVLALTPVIDHAASIRKVDLIRALRFRPLALVNVASGLIHLTVAVLLAPTAGVWGLVIGLLAASAASTVGSYLIAPHVPRLLFDRAATAPLVRFGKWIFVTAIVDVLGAAALQVIISRRLGSDALGLYYLSTRLALFPHRTILGLVSGVAFPVHAELQNKPVLGGSVFRSSLSAMMTLLGPVYVVAIAVTPGLVEQLLGPNWSGTISIIRWLAVAGVVGIIAEAALPMLKGRGQSDGVAKIYGVKMLVVVSLAWWLTGSHGVAGAAIAWLAGDVARSVYAARRVRRLAPHPFAGIPRRTVVIGIAAAGGAVVALGVSVAASGFVGVVGGVAIGMITSLVLLRWLDRFLESGLTDELIRVFPWMSRWVRA